MQPAPLLLVFRHSPYSGGLAKAALDTALAAAAFDQPVKLLFLDSGVLQLVKSQSTESIGRKNIAKQLSALPLYGLDSVLVDSVALQRYGLATDDCVLPCEPLDVDGVRSILRASRHILSF